MILLRTVGGQPYLVLTLRKDGETSEDIPGSEKPVQEYIYMYKLHVEHQAVNHPSMVLAD